MKDRVELFIGDSRNLGLSPLYAKIGMVIVDGGHSYQVAKADTQNALRLVQPSGVIIWDDYGPY